MKKLLVLILITLLAVLCVYTIFQGVSLGNFKILGIEGIDSKNDLLDETINVAAQKAQTEFPKAKKLVTDNTKKLKEAKSNYEDMTEISDAGDIEAANQIEKYEYESLMVKLGRHATSNGADLNIVTEKGNIEGVYNLKFYVEGRYISVLDFISAIENDSTLGFKIEDFEMTPITSGKSEDTQQRVLGTFNCRSIAIVEVEGVADPTENEEGDENENSENTNTTTETNTTNTTSETNTTNTTNMTNPQATVTVKSNKK